MTDPLPRSRSPGLVFSQAPGVFLEQTCVRLHPVVPMGSNGEEADAGQC
jgi:hypothetical protein